LLLRGCIDRLTRSVAFLSRPLEAGVDVRFADLPALEVLRGTMLQQMCAVAELEAGFISDRTKRALAAAKARVKRLGGNRGVVLTRAAREAGRDMQVARAAARAADLAPVLTELRQAGIGSLGRIARALTERGIPTARGHSEWTPMQVARIKARLPAAM
jgi:DNA invertase Pin-like site-specific DNA recombinase